MAAARYADQSTLVPRCPDRISAYDADRACSAYGVGNHITVTPSAEEIALVTGCYTLWPGARKIFCGETGPAFSIIME